MTVYPVPPGPSHGEQDPTRRPVYWLETRPAPAARKAGEIASATLAVDELADSIDPRLAALGAGARIAIGWVTNGGPAPVSGRHPDGLPCVREIAQEIYDAGGGDHGTTVFVSERARIVARGIQEWLAWTYLQGYPTPWWLLGAALPAREIHRFVLGRVGLDPAGLDGPPSSERFAYEVGEWVGAIDNG